MPKRHFSQTDFTGGELTPLLHGRSDTEVYRRGLRTATNCQFDTRGPVRKRSGTRYVAEVKDSSKETWLKSFQFSAEDGVVFEMGDLYMRFLTGGGTIANPANITNGTFDSDISDWTDNSTGTGSIAHDAVDNRLQITSGASSNYGIAEQSFAVIANVKYTLELDVITSSCLVKIGTATGLGDIVSQTLSTGTNKQITFTPGSNDTYYLSLQPAADSSTTEVDNIEIKPAAGTSSLSITNGSFTSSLSPWTGWSYGSGQAKTTTYAASLAQDIGTCLADVEYNVTFTLSGTDASVNARIYDVSGTPTLLANENFSAGTNVFTFTPSSSVALQLRFVNNNSAGDIAYIDNVSISPGSFTTAAAITNGTFPSNISGWTDNSTGTGSIAHDAGNQRMDITNGAAPAVGKATQEITCDVAEYTLTFDVNDASVDVQIGTTSGGSEVTQQTFSTGASQTLSFTPSSAGSVYVSFTPTAASTTVEIDNVSISPSVLQVTTPWETKDLPNLMHAQHGNLIYFAHGDHQPRVLTRTDNENWSIAVHDPLASSSSIFSTPNWPHAVAVHNQRLFYANTDANPNRIWVSVLGDFDDNTEDSTDSTKGFTLDINHGGSVTWMASARDLMVGTSDTEYSLNSGRAEIFQATTATVQPRTREGGANRQPIVKGDEVIFLHGDRKEIRNLIYDFSVDGYVSEDIDFTGAHLIDKQVRQIAYGKEPYSNVYAVLENGSLAVGIYDREKNVLGWSEWTTNGAFESVATISNGTREDVYVIVKRTVNGATKRFIEYIVPGDGTDDLDAFTDSSLTLSTPLTITGITAANPAVVTSTAHGLSNGDKVIIKDLKDPDPLALDSTATNMSDLNQKTFTVANKTDNTFELSGLDTSAYNAYGSGGVAFKKITAISGLDHLEGETVTVLGDGAKQSTKTVSSGAITAGKAAGEFVVGLAYTMTVETLNPEYDIGLGPMQGHQTSYPKPIVRILNSHKPTVNGQLLPARSAGDISAQKVPLFTGDLEYGPIGWTDTGRITITSSEPLPVTVIGIFGSVDGGSR